MKLLKRLWRKLRWVLDGRPHYPVAPFPPGATFVLPQVKESDFRRLPEGTTFNLFTGEVNLPKEAE